MKSRNYKRNKNKFAYFAPLKFIVFWILVTFAITLWGPIGYHDFPILKTFTFLMFVLIFIIVGYTHAVNVDVHSSKIKISPKNNDKNVAILLDISLVISWFGLLYSIITSLQGGSLNTDISSIGETYIQGYEEYERNSGNYSISFILYSLTLPFTFIAFVLGFYYFSKLDISRRAIIVALTLTSLFYYVIGTGKQKQVGDILIYIFVIAALKYAIKGKKLPINLIFNAVIIGILGLFSFIYVLGSRYSALGVDIINVNQRVLNRTYIDTDHPIFLIFGDDYGLGLSFFSGYLSQGYYGLGLALETEWNWTYFQSFSYSLSVIANRFFGLEWQWPNSLLYQVGLTTGWGETKWHTVFTHFATDFTFPGTVVLFGFFSFAYARCWLKAIKYKNPFAILLFTLMTMGVFFMPANNQLMHSPGALFTLCIIVFLYLYMGPRYDKREKNH